MGGSYRFKLSDENWGIWSIMVAHLLSLKFLKLESEMDIGSDNF